MRETDRQTDCQTATETERETETERDRQRERQTDGQTDRQIQTDRTTTNLDRRSNYRQVGQNIQLRYQNVLFYFFETSSQPHIRVYASSRLQVTSV